MRRTRTVYIGLGSNLGDRASYLSAALEQVGALDGVRVAARSGLYETAPMYLTEQPSFINAVAQLEVAGSVEALLLALMQVEAALGRVREVINGPRTMDLDVLLAGALRLETPTLTLPHPLLHERAFVLAPLMELAPQLVHPTLGETVSQLWARCPDQGSVRRLAHVSW